MRMEMNHNHPLAPNALTTPEDVKAALGIPEDSEDRRRDAFLTMLINAASAYVERITDRKLGRQTYDEAYFAYGGQKLVLAQYPVRVVESVTDTQSGQIIDPSAYDSRTGAAGGILYKDDGWPCRIYRQGIAHQLAAFSRVLRVRYTAGYILPGQATRKEACDLPFDLQMIVWQMVQREYALVAGGANGLSSFAISDVSWTFDKSPRQEWAAVLEAYRRF